MDDVIAIDRSSELRTDLKFLENALLKDETKFLFFKNFLPLAIKNNGRKEICVVTKKEIGNLVISHCFEDLKNDWPETLVFLGIENKGTGNEVAWFTFQIDSAREDEFLSVRSDTYFLNDRWKLIYLLHEHQKVVSQAKAMLHWLDRYRFCATCGSHMKIEEAGYKRTCVVETCRSNKGIHNTCYPRTDPTVIMCVTSPDNASCLLGRKSTFPPRMYSCLAGFLEPGETIEEAVIRETKEESGIDIDQIKYIASQAWPFPSSLMIGCKAVATSLDIRVCPEEMEDVKWFPRNIVGNATRGDTNTLLLPPKEALARQLIEEWLNDKDTVKSVL